MSEFIQFSQDGLHESTIGHEVQLWGTRDYSDATLEGVSFHWPDNWDEFNPDRFDDDDDYDPAERPRLDCAMDLAESAGVPLIWIGESRADWRNLDGEAEIGVIERSGGEYSADTIFFDIHPDSGSDGRSEMEGVLQEIMGTSLSKYDTNKEENQKITPIQHWVRNNMPKHYTVIDIDLFVGSSDGSIEGLVEIRRSDWPNSASRPTRDWWPWMSDRRNYYLLADAAERAGAEAILIHHLPEQLEDDSEVGYYTSLSYSDFDWNRIKSKYERYTSEEKAREWLNFDVEYITAGEAVSQLRQLRE